MSIANAQNVTNHRRNGHTICVGQSTFEPHAGAREFFEKIVMENRIELRTDTFEFSQFFADAFLLGTVALEIFLEESFTSGNDHDNCYINFTYAYRRSTFLRSQIIREISLMGAQLPRIR